MGIGLLKTAMEMIKSITDLCKKVVDAGDSEKYANSVETLNKGVSATYAKMRDIIANDQTLSADEKLSRLQELAEREETAKKRAGEDIQENRKYISNVVLEVFKGLLTCGLSFTPAIVRKLKKSLGDDLEVPKIEGESDDAVVEIDLTEDAG